MLVLLHQPGREREEKCSYSLEKIGHEGSGLTALGFKLGRENTGGRRLTRHSPHANLHNIFTGGQNTRLSARPL
jgi:hypothetical protein